MSRIDELQRLHEAATKNSNLPWIWVDRDRAWPAILRVLVAARERSLSGHDDDCPAGYTGMALRGCVCGHRQLEEALRALEKQP